MVIERKRRGIYGCKGVLDKKGEKMKRREGGKGEWVRGWQKMRVGESGEGQGKTGGRGRGGKGRMGT